MTNSWDIRTMIIVIIGVVMLLIIVQITGFFVYASYDFTAEVESIDFYGRSAGFASGADKTVIRFSDGSVYNLYNLPDGLKEGHTYQMQWQRPYVLGSERLMVIEEVE